MNIREYISSGAVESYVLGLGTPEERAEFERLCEKHPALLEARIEFETKLEDQALTHGITPAPFVKDKILSSIRNIDNIKEEARVVSLEQRPRSGGLLKFIAAASVVLLLASAYFAYEFYTRNRNLERSTADLKSTIDSLSTEMTRQKEMMDIVAKPGMTVVNMVGTQQNPSSADIYWDTTSTDVYMVVKNMPQLPNDKQYQLWAFINQQPVDLGLFDVDRQNFFLKMKNTQKAEAFAITIEKRGNGPVPQGTVETYGKTRL